MEFRDLKQQYQVLKKDIDQAIFEVTTACNFISGEQVNKLEKQLADYVGVKHCVSCANGTDALCLAMMAWGIQAGDAVFVPDFTFFSTGEIVSFVGATPIFVDVEFETYNMDPACLEKAIQKVLVEGKLTPKVVIAVDLFGLPADFETILKIAQRYGLRVLEDGAQGFGGQSQGKRACSLGHVATTSFFPAKPLGCYGDGGAIFTNDDELAALLHSLCVHGKGEGKYDNVRIGLNSRLDTLQAAILMVKLDAFSKYELIEVNKIAQWYTEYLRGTVQTPVVPEGFYSSWAQYTIQLNSKEQRDKVQAKLNAAGIPSMVYYRKPMHTQTAFSCYSYDGGCPVTEKLCNTVLSLPMHPYLTKDQVELIANCLLQAIE